MNEYESKKDNDKCVRVNIYVKCDNKETCGNEVWEKKDYKKNDTCVDVNIFAECKRGEWKKDDTCVEVNVFAECNKK